MILSSEQSQESKVANPFAEPVSSHEVIRPLKYKTGTAYQLFTYVTGKRILTGTTPRVPLNTAPTASTRRSGCPYSPKALSTARSP